MKTVNVKDLTKLYGELEGQVERCEQVVDAIDLTASLKETSTIQKLLLIQALDDLKEVVKSSKRCMMHTVSITTALKDSILAPVRAKKKKVVEEPVEEAGGVV